MAPTPGGPCRGSFLRAAGAAIPLGRGAIGAVGRPAAAALIVTLDDPGRLAGPAAQIIELGAPHATPAQHLDPGDLRAVQRKDPLDAFAVADLAHRERGVDA